MKAGSKSFATSQNGATLTRIWLKCKDPKREEEYREAVATDFAKYSGGLYPYRTRLLLYTFLLYATMLLELCCVVVVYEDDESSTNLTAQLLILLILLCLTAPLFAVALLKQKYWARVLSQGFSFFITAVGYLLLDGHFLHRETGSGGVRESVNGVVPIALLATVLPPVLMYSWGATCIVACAVCGVGFGLRGGGLEWRAGVLEVAMLFLSLLPALLFLRHREQTSRNLFCKDAPPAQEFLPLKRSKTVVFSPREEEVVGTDLEDILIKLDKLQMMIHDTAVPDDFGQKQWAEETLEELMTKLATGKNIYQSTIQRKGGNVDPENLVYLEQNYLQKGVDDTAAKMSSVNDTKSGTQSDISLAYSMSELLPFLQRLGKDWNFDIFFVSQCTDNHALQTCGGFSVQKFNFQDFVKAEDESFRAFFDKLAAVLTI